MSPEDVRKMKILIVDDEMMIKEWLKYTITSLPFEINVLDTASNGIEALEKTSSETFDLIFIDITMPKMNGIELLKNLYEQAIDSILIVLSSHDEFQFAREAIKYNIKEYILKNECSKEKLSEILYSCQEKLATRSFDSELTQELMERVLFGSIPIKSIDMMAKSYAKLGGKIFFVAAIQMEKDNYEKIYENRRFRLKSEGLIGRYKEISFLLYSLENLDQAGSLNYEYSKLLSDKTGKVISCGKLCRDTKEILSECRNSWIGYQNLFFSTERHCSGINQYRGFDSDTVEALYEKAMTSIRSYIKDETNTILNDINTLFRKTRPTETERIIDFYLALMDTYIIYNNLKSKNITKTLNSIRSGISRFEKFEQLADWVLMAFENGSDLIDRMDYSPPVEKALEYIEANFRTITNTQEIAEYINLSPDYFSRLFKKEVGDSLNSYLINYRLDKASVILISTNLTVQEVAEKVGIENGSYFSKCFKKKFHTQPIQFRIQTKKSGN